MDYGLRRKRIMVSGGRGLWIQTGEDYGFRREGIMDSGGRGLWF